MCSPEKLATFPEASSIFTFFAVAPDATVSRKYVPVPERFCDEMLSLPLPMD